MNNKKLVENITSNNLIECEQFLKQILYSKCSKLLEDKKYDMLVQEGNPETKKEAKRVYRKLGKISRNQGDSPRSITAAGRKMVSTMEPSQLKAVLATEGTVKAENKDKKREYEKDVGKAMERNHGGGGGTTGRLMTKLLPSETIKKILKKPEKKHGDWVNSMGFYRTPVTETMDVEQFMETLYLEDALNEAKPMAMKDVHKLLTNGGFVVDRQTGSHKIYKHKKQGTTFSVPSHGKEVSVGVVRQMMQMLNPKLVAETVVEDVLNEAKPMHINDVHDMLTNSGFVRLSTKQRGKGSHYVYKHQKTGRIQSISHHKNEVSVGVVRKAIEAIKAVAENNKEQIV